MPACVADGLSRQQQPPIWLTIPAMNASPIRQSSPPAADPFARLSAQGLNLQAVFNLAELPADILASLSAADQAYRQLLLIGHGGPLLWQRLALQGRAGDDPVDTFSRTQIAAWLDAEHPGCAYRFAYPGPCALNLQRLGELAGWHHASPFMLGVNSHWGSWFAYRAVVLADTCLAPTSPLPGTAPCSDCASRICIARCPARALDDGCNLRACMDYRLRADSACKDRCLARNSCPVGSSQRYSSEQISYHYGLSMRMIEHWQPRQQARPHADPE